MAPNAAQIPVDIDPSAIELAIPLADLQERYPGTELVVGIVILRRNVSSTTNERSASKGRSRILIVRRAPHELFSPSMWELPSGCAEAAKDTSVIATAIRKTKEETGLAISRVLCVFEWFSYTSGSGRVDPQFIFIVEVKGEGEEGGMVQLNPDGHDQYAWISHDGDLDRYAMTRETRVVVEEALRIVARL